MIGLEERKINANAWMWDNLMHAYEQKNNS